MLVRAVVIDNKDPLHRGRLKIRAYGWHDELPDGDLPWAEPCLPFGGDKDYGLFVIPEVGSTVWVSFEVDDTFQPNPMCPVWMGVWWGQSEVPQEAQGGDYRTYMFKTPKGNLIVVSDSEDSINIRTAQGDLIRLDGKSRSIKIETQSFRLSFNNGNTEVTTWSISGDVNINGNLFVSGNISSIGQTTAQGGLKTLPGGQVIFVDDLVNKYNSHTHTDSTGGSTSTPDQTLP